MTLLTLYLITSVPAFLVWCIICYIGYQDNSLKGSDFTNLAISLFPIGGLIIGSVGAVYLLTEVGEIIARKLFEYKSNKFLEQNIRKRYEELK